MPIEIKELHVKINVSSQGAEDTSKTSAQAQQANNIGDTVEAVMELIKKSKER